MSRSYGNGSRSDLGGLIEKLSSPDKDLRYMAVSDLYKELKQPGFSCTATLEASLCEWILKKTEDPSSDVCGLATKCLAPLLSYASDANARMLVASLCNIQRKGTTSSGGSSLFKSVSLKTLIAEVPAAEGKASSVLADEAAPRMIEVMKSSGEQKGGASAIGESLDILSDLVKKFYFHKWSSHPDIASILLDIFSSPSSDAFVRKKCTACVAALAPHLDDAQLAKVVATCVESLCAAPLGGGAHTLGRAQSSLLRSQVNCVASLVTSVGSRQGLALAEALPRLTELCERHEEEQEDCDDTEALCDLREACLHCFEAFVSGVRGLDASHEGSHRRITSLCVSYASYDPNYAHDEMDVDDEDEENQQGESMDTGENGGGGVADDEDDDDDDFGGSDYDDDGAYSDDDDDTSWKCRKAAVQCLVAVVQAFPHRLAEIFEVAFDALVAQLKDRDESVRCEVICGVQAFLAALAERSKAGDGACAGACAQVVNGKVARVAKGALKELSQRGGASRVKLGYIGLLRDLAQAPGVTLLPHASDLLKHVQGLINDPNLETNVKVEAFGLLQGLFHLSEENAYNTKALKELLSTLLTSAEQKSFKVSAAAFQTMHRALELIYRKWDSVYENVIVDIYDMAYAQVIQADIDQEVREEAIKSLGLLLSLFPSHLPGRSDKALVALYDRTVSESTRVPAVKTLAKIASSGQVDMSCIAERLEADLSSYLRKADHNLRVSALSALATLVETGRLAGDPEVLVKNVSGLISDADVPLASSSIHVLCSLMSMRGKQSVEVVVHHAQPMVLALIRSPLVQGTLAEPLQAFFSSLASLLTVKRCQELLALVEQIGAEPGAKQQVRKTAAKCIASVCQSSKGKGSKSADYAARSVEAASSGDGGDPGTVLALFCVAEIGRALDLAAIDGTSAVVLGCLESPSEGVRAAASYALGCLCSRSPDHYLPVVFEHTERKPKLGYLLLLSLKEVLASAGELTADHVSRVRDFLLLRCETDEEAMRIICAECLGHLVLLDPRNLVPELAQVCSSEVAERRECCVAAYRDAVNSDRIAGHEEVVLGRGVLEAFLSRMGDTDPRVRKASILLLNVLLHAHIGAVGPLLPTSLSLLHKCFEFDPNSLREVMLGPFKQIVDDLLVVRRAAFECALAAVNKCFDAISPEADAFLDLVISGATDHYDISKTSHLTLSDHYSMKMTCFGILSKLCEVCPAVCVKKASAILPPLYKTLIYKLKSDAVKQETERLEEVQNACMRCVKSLSRVPGMQDTEMFGKLMISFNRNEELLRKYRA